MRLLRWIARLWRKPVRPTVVTPRTSMRILTDVANPAAPTVAELESGLDISCYLTDGPLTFDPTPLTVEPCLPSPWHLLKEGDVIRAHYPNGDYRDITIGKPIPQGSNDFLIPIRPQPPEEPTR